MNYKYAGWIGVDFDGTLATYGTWAGASHVGEPIAPMVERVKRWLAEGREVRVFTARIHPLDTCVAPTEKVVATEVEMAELRDAAIAAGFDPERYEQACQAVLAIRCWCQQHLGQVLPITNIKDYGMVELWDDRAVQVRANTGEMLGHSTRGLA